MAKKSDKSNVQKEVTSTGLVFDKDYVDDAAIERTLIESVTEPEVTVIVEENDIKAVEENFGLVAVEEIKEILEKSIPKTNPKSMGRGKYRVMMKLGKI